MLFWCCELCGDRVCLFYLRRVDERVDGVGEEGEGFVEQEGEDQGHLAEPGKPLFYHDPMS